MTTIIREQNMVYTDSCITMPIGTEYSRIYGAIKLFVTPDKKVAMGITGGLPEHDIADYVCNVLAPQVVLYLSTVLTASPVPMLKLLKAFLKGLVKSGDETSLRCTLIFFTKAHTYQITIRHSKRMTRVDDFIMQAQHTAVYGSGAAWYLAQKDISKLTIAERFAAVYQTDPHSGGPVHAFDLNQLKDL